MSKLLEDCRKNPMENSYGIPEENDDGITEKKSKKRIHSELIPARIIGRIFVEIIQEISAEIIFQQLF